jgi:hypothetical protein
VIFALTTWLPYLPWLPRVNNLVAMVKKQSKAVPLHTMEALEGRGGIAPTVKYLIAMVHKESKSTVEQDHLTTLNTNNFKIIDAVGLKIIASRLP